MNKPSSNPSYTLKKNRRSFRRKPISIRRLSPFLLVAIFLVFNFFYMLAANTGTTTKIIAIPFVTANIAFTDFALWNYFEGKKKGVIWALEGLISTIIVYWVI
jgi:hypothetical protein